METLLDLTGEEEPILVVDPLGDGLAEVARRLFESAAERVDEVEEALRGAAEAVAETGREPVVPFRPELFPFFAIEEGVRRRVPREDAGKVAEKIARGEGRASADVLTRPVLKALALPAAVSVLGPSEIAYHSQSLPLFPLFDAPLPVLVPRTFVVPRGPAERRAAAAVGIAEENLLDPTAWTAGSAPVVEAERVEGIAGRLASELDSLGSALAEVDSTLAGALETAKRKATYQIEQLAERVRKAAERKDEVAVNRRRRLAAMILPGGEPAERVYPPLAFLLTWGPRFRDAMRSAAGNGGTVVVVDADGPVEAEARQSHAG
jgi:uncharacterized protein YllA (UPF0747 family)